MPKRIAALAIVPTVACAALAVPALAATKPKPKPAPAPKKTTIDVGDNFFGPDRKTVAEDATVTWDWIGTAPHNVTVVTGPQKFRSPVQTSGTYTRKLTKAGTYEIVCTIHPGMALTLKVR